MLSEPLLPSPSASVRSVFLTFSLPLCILSSAFGMVLFKCAQLKGRTSLLVGGYVLEGLAFAIYPLSLRRYSLCAVSTLWATGSTVTAVLASGFFDGEMPSLRSLVGCGLVVVGVFLANSTGR